MSGDKISSGNGNLSRARIDAKPKEGASGTKDNSECASLRLGNLPQSLAVRQVDAEKNAGAAKIGPEGYEVQRSGTLRHLGRAT
jgi:hypothetical protein